MKNEILHIRINQVLLDNLKKQAQNENTNLSSLIDRIIRNYLQKQKNTKK
jgi:metal-responsive CopG/Arc/MetJ family transcriptional regulator